MTPTARNSVRQPTLLILNQMAGPLTTQFAEDWARAIGPVALLTGHPETLAKGSTPEVTVDRAAVYTRGNYLLGALSWVAYFCRAFFWIRHFRSTVPVLFYTSPPILPALARLLCRRRNQPYAVMVHDVYPDVLVRLGELNPSSAVTRVWRRLNSRALEHADLVMTLGDRMAAALRENFNEHKTKRHRIEIIQPWADGAEIRPRVKSENAFAIEHDQVSKITIGYSGNMGFSHDVEMLLSIAERMKGDPQFHFLLIGAGSKWGSVAAELQERNLPNLTLLPWQPESVFPQSVAAADIAFISLKEGLAGMSFPSRAFSFMAAGAALLVSSPPGNDVADLVEQHQLGWLVAPGDAGAVCRVLENLTAQELATRKTNSRRAAETIGSRRNSESMVHLLATAFRAT